VLPPCSLLVKKWAKAPKYGGEKEYAGGLINIIKKDRRSTKYFAAKLMVVSAVKSGKVTPYSLVSIPPSPTLRKRKIT